MIEKDCDRRGRAVQPVRGQFGGERQFNRSGEPSQNTESRKERDNMYTSVIGYPRIGELRELKFACEGYFKKEISYGQLEDTARALRRHNWEMQKAGGIDFIPSNDFSFYDGLLDTAFMLGIIPKRYLALKLPSLDTYFAMARGYQGERGDVKALAMKKWFNTNYHYMVPEIEDTCHIALEGTKPFDEFAEAKALKIMTKPVITGPYTLLKLSRFTGKRTVEETKGEVIDAYRELTKRLSQIGAEWIQFDEPGLVKDMSKEDIRLFQELYGGILTRNKDGKALLQTYFGDVRDCYQEIISLPFDGIGIDFVEGKQSLKLLGKYGFPEDKILFAGVVNGKNIWKNHYKKTLELLSQIGTYAKQVVLGASCSLQHVPCTLRHETKLPEKYTQYFSFAEEKLGELGALKEILSSEEPLISEGTPLSEEPILPGKPLSSSSPLRHPAYLENCNLFAHRRGGENPSVKIRVKELKDGDFIRLPEFAEREAIQKAEFCLPLFPTTTIGSFPQTKDVRANRSAYKKGRLDEDQYREFNRDKIRKCILLQEEIGLDVLVHGEYERNDMVEYFGECLDGFLFTEHAWVQSYGTRCVKPPVIWGDISRSRSMTAEYSVYAQSLTSKPVKGMLTGPVTILNWSFPREDISLGECAFQIALSIREEVLELESDGIKIIQIDEAALREKLPLRRQDWNEDYLDWAIPAFRLVHSGVKANTQIHTHMCYSEFGDIIEEIDKMDADVITFEASRSDLTIMDALNQCGFRTQVGPGVYDIHSPRIPSVKEMVEALERMLLKVPAQKLWVNPDCGLKTRGEEETTPSLKNLVAAAAVVRGRVAK